MLRKAMSILITSVCTNVVQETPGTKTYWLWFKVRSVLSTPDSADRHAEAEGVKTMPILFVHDVYCWAWLCGFDHAVISTPHCFTYT